MNLSAPQSIIIDALKCRLSELKDFRLIDEYHSQSVGDAPRLAYPAALIDIEDCQYESAGEGSQFATASVSVRVIQANYSQSSLKAPQKSKERALNVYELEALVVKTLHGWAPTLPDDDGVAHQIAAPFIRTQSSKEDNDTNGLRVRQVQFSTAWEETFGNNTKAYPTIAIDSIVVS